MDLSVERQNKVLALFYIFSLLLLYIISREILDYTRFFSLLVTLLIGLNIHLLYILFNGFFGQILGVGFFLGLFLTMYYPLMKNKEGNTFLTFLPLNCLFCYGLVSSYHILVPLFFCPLGLFIMAYYVHSRSKPFLFRSIIYCILTLLICAIMSPSSFFYKISASYSQIFAGPGWGMPILSPEWIFGLVGKGTISVLGLETESIFFVFKKRNIIY